MLHRLMRRTDRGTDYPVEPYFPDAHRHADAVAWTLRQISLHGRWLGHLDLFDEAHAAAGELLAALGAPGAKAPDDLSVTTAEVVDGLRLVVHLAERGDEAALATARRLAEVVEVRTSRLGIDSVVALDGRSPMAQRGAVVPDLVGAVR